MRLSNASRLLIAVSAVLVSGFVTVQDASATSDRLFALGRAGTDTSLLDVTISPFSSVEVGLVDIGDAVSLPISGIAFQPGTGTLFASSARRGTDGEQNGPGSRSLYTLDTTTAAATLIGEFNLPIDTGDSSKIQDIAFDAGGTLYGSNINQLYTIDLVTGAVTATSSPFHGGTFLALNINAIAVHPITDALYGISWDDSELFTIDPSTGIATSGGLFTGLETELGAVDTGSLAFDSAGVLYAGSQDGEIYALDLTDLTQVTSIGTPGSPVSGLAFQPAVAGLLADFDGDEDVDGADFLALQRGFGTSFTGADFDNWEAEFGTGVGAVSAVSAVPEPSALALLMLGAIGLGALRTRKS